MCSLLLDFSEGKAEKRVVVKLRVSAVCRRACLEKDEEGVRCAVKKRDVE